MSKSKNHTDLQPISPTDLKPVYVKIIKVNDHIKNTVSYDAEVYSGNNIFCLNDLRPTNHGNI